MNVVLTQIFGRFVGYVCLEISRCYGESILIKVFIIHYYAHHADYLMRLKKNSVKPHGFREEQKSAKNQNLEYNST